MKDHFKAEIDKPHKVALYASMEHDWVMVWEVRYDAYDERYNKLPDGQMREIPREGYVRLTEPVDIKFTAITDDEMVQKAVESLNEEERKAIEALNAKIASIRDRKSQLLALTNQKVY
jgi:hypothetical protein